jgi:hypothetical protein
MQPRCTAEQKAEALAILAAHGKAEAARRTGIPAGTIASWGSRHGITSPPAAELEKANAAKTLAWEDRKITMAQRLGEVAGKALDRIAERVEADRLTGIRDLATTMAICVDKAQLLAGGATTRTEAIVPVEVAELRDDLAARRSA